MLKNHISFYLITPYSMKKDKKVTKAEEYVIDDSEVMPANSFTALYRGRIGFFSSTFRHLGERMECKVTADMQGSNLYVVLIIELTPTCSIEVSKVLQTNAGRFSCTATRIRLQRQEKTIETDNDKTIVLVPSASSQEKAYYIEFFK